MQNKFLANLFKRVAQNSTYAENPNNFTFSFQSFTKVQDLQNCLDSKVCTLSLDYEQQIVSSSKAPLTMQPLPILTDKVMYVNNKNLDEPMITGIFMTFWWIIGIGGVCFFALLFFSRNEFF